MTAPEVRTPPARGANAEDQRTDAAIVTGGDAERKAFATMQAQAARAGCGLHELASGAFLLTRWGLSRELPDMRAVAGLLAQMGVRA